MGGCGTIVSKWSSLFIIAVVAVFVGVLAFSAFVTDRYFLWLSLLLLILVMLPFYVRFERKAFSSREIVLIAVLAAIAAISRVPFAPLPSVQPTSFVIIVSAIVLGKEAGFLIGATAALVSNLFLGQGPWTLWQMFSWGLMGLTAGLLGRTFILQNKWGRILFGFVWGFLFGWIMNLSFLLTFLQEITWVTFLGAYAASVYFDLAHALSNVFFLGLFSTQWIKVLTRFKGKYGLLDEGKEQVR
ncbi:ECF transporter S component [Ectobacillus funiculus]|nr:ECF transporter S component [Ectobacillus funiculus]